MRRSMVGLIAVIAVAGCHGNEDGAKPSHRDNQAAAAIDDAVAANSTAASMAGLPVPPLKAHALAYQISPSFIGRWGMTRADCDPDSMAVKGLLTISADKLKFWESKGNVQRIVRHSPYDITLDLNMTGEGRNWTSATRLTLDAAATILVRSEASSPTHYRYQRC